MMIDNWTNNQPAVENEGVAYLFDASTGELRHILSAPDPATEDGFGSAVSLFGTTALVSAPGKDIRGQSDAGAAYIFDARTGLPQFRLTSPTPEQSGSFGFAVAGVSRFAFVAAPREDHSGLENAGSIHVFSTRTGRHLETFSAPDPQAGDGFGFSLAVDGSWLLAGAPYADEGASDAGAAYLIDSANDLHLQTFLNPNPQAGDNFGISVALLGDRALISAPKADVVIEDRTANDTGVAYLFDTLTGELLLTLSNPEPGRGDEFGQAIALVEDHIIIGSRDDDTSALNAGSVYVFDALSGELTLTIRNPDIDEGDSFGRSIAATDSYAVIGSRYESDLAERSGAAYSIDLSEGATQSTFTNPAPDPYDLFAHSVAALNEHVLIGAIGDSLF